MKIVLKLFASLGPYLPVGSKANMTEVDVEEGSTPEDVLSQFDVPAEKVHLVMVNGVYVYPSERNSLALTSGDALAVWPPVAGG